MDWMTQLEAGIRNALIQQPVFDYWVVVHNQVQELWGRVRAKEIIQEHPLLLSPNIIDQLEFRIVKDKQEREQWPVGSLIHF